MLEQGTVEFLAGADFTYGVDITLFSNDELVGGYKFNWTPSSQQLETAEQVLFHTIADADASQEERFQLLANLEQLSAQIQEPEVR
ncbi:TPA: hypothetical protein HA241_06265 [Candidatus Woesearchaeota archaeon]|nr:hypothetical protein [Candidatus Woesearchaeota archaeon]